jgi:hypothetical protein
MKPVYLILSLVFTTSVVAAQNQAFISTEQAVEDIDYMISSIEAIHYNPYFKTSREDFYRYKEQLVGDFDKDSISLKLFIATGMKLSAHLSGGHTAMDWQNNQIIPELMGYHFLPFTGALSAGDSTFTVSRSAHQDIKKGAVVKAVNGISVVELYEECMAYFGGIASYKNASCEKAFPLYLFFTNKLFPPYDIQLADSEIHTAGLDVSGINSFLSEGQAVDNYTFGVIDNEIGLITYNSCTDYEAFEVFLNQTFKEIAEQKINKLIIDIRTNGGGDSNLNDLLLSYLTTKPYQQSSGRYWKVSQQAKEAYKENGYEHYFGDDFMQSYYEAENGSIIESFEEALTHPEKPAHYFSGQSCFLIGPNTFSSANFLADAIKTYELSTLIGSATGELTNDFGELIQFVLPNSGNYVYVSSTYDIGANGKPDLFQPVYPDIQTQGDALEYAIKNIRGQ